MGRSGHVALTYRMPDKPGAVASVLLQNEMAYSLRYKDAIPWCLLPLLRN